MKFSFSTLEKEK